MNKRNENKKITIKEEKAKSISLQRNLNKTIQIIEKQKESSVTEFNEQTEFLKDTTKLDCDSSRSPLLSFSSLENCSARLILKTKSEY